ncbi:hypothetical protein ACFO4L_16285 [Bacillus daqingensis]|uniref:Nucleotidase n=1 Tax=Bacillus daqingensis TaxID=872396 RepID=A0ABV9NZM6_9BACI
MAHYRFGIDIDGTVTHPGTFLPHLNKHFNKNLTLDDLTEYDLTGVLGVTEAEFWKWMQKHESTLYRQSVLADQALETLNNWNRQVELFYISARPDYLYHVTEEWFERLNVPYDHIELLGQHDKIEAVREHQVDTFFEDKHDNAVNIAEEFGIPVILMDTPYNQKAIPDNVHRAKDWTHARSIVNGLFTPSVSR